jgi:hypothetical protein
MLMNADINEITVVAALQEFEPGNLPPRLFEAVARIAVYPAVEFIPLRERNGKVEVLLFQRPDDDIQWPAMWHTPGTILRPTDQTYRDVFQRLLDDELRGTHVDEPIFMGAELSHNLRGRCVLLEHLLVVRGEPCAGKFFTIDNLPSKFIEDQRASLERAVSFFLGLQSGN